MNRFVPKILIGVIVLFLVVVAGFMMISGKREKGLEVGPSPSVQASQSGDSSEEYYDGSSGAQLVPGTPVPSPASISEYVYPGSQSMASDSAKLELKTKDTIKRVTSWYANKIKEIGFNAISAASTEIDGQVFSKISAAKPGEKIEVTIKKDQTTSSTIITVDSL